MQLNFACVEFLQWLAPTWFENKKAKKASTIRREPREIVSFSKSSFDENCEFQRKCESLRRFSSIESIDSAYDAALVKVNSISLIVQQVFGSNKLQYAICHVIYDQRI